MTPPPDALRRGYSAAQLRAAEAPLLARGVPLMRQAAAALAAEARALLAERGGSRVLVLAGAGDNGGDALFAAAELAASAEVAIVRTGSRVHDEGLAAARSAGAHEAPASDAADLAAHADLVLDGMLGIGAAPPLRGVAREAALAILPVLVRDARPLVVAVDLPSGLSPDDGPADDAVLPADVTVTFGAVKAGLLLGDGPRLAGRVVLVDLGLDLSDFEPVVTA